MIRPIKIFRIGSKVFFDEVSDYIPKDIDELCIMDSFPFKENTLHANGLQGNDVLFCRNMDKDGFIRDAIESGVPMRAGKFLVPEFAEYLKLTIDDLKRLESLFDTIDEKHKYEKIIFDAYIKNGGFFLSDEQRKEAYNSYKKARS